MGNVVVYAVHLNTNVLKISDLPRLLNERFVGKPKHIETRLEIDRFISSYVHTWATENNLTFECEKDILLLLRGSIVISSGEGCL